MPSPSNASYLIIARFVFVFLNIISILEVSKKNMYNNWNVLYIREKEKKKCGKCNISND